MHGPKVLMAATTDAQSHEAVSVVNGLRSVEVLVVLVILLHSLPLERGATRPLAKARSEPSVFLDDI